MKCLNFILALIASVQLFAQQTSTRSTVHELNPSVSTIIYGYYWSEAKPVLRIHSGDKVTVRTLITSTPDRLVAAGLPPEQVEKELRDIQAITDKGPGGHPLTGPIFIEEAEPGDVLEVKIIAIDLVLNYGYNAIGQNGFLSDEIFDRKMMIIPLDREKMLGHFNKDIEIPLRPFFGSMGVAPPKEAGRISSAPPWIHAGNLDNKELVAGTSLFIPVHVKGALFEIGDGHAAQGNGEVDITAIETSLKGQIQFIVHKDMHLKWPRAETPTHIIAMGCDRDLVAATRIAVNQIIDYLMTEKKLSQSDAYMLASISADVNITELVDGNVGVHVMLPKSIFIKSR